MKQQLFELTQFCHDNSEDFVDEFMDSIIDQEEYYSIDGFYFSGSNVLVLYTDEDLVAECRAYFKTNAVLSWVDEIKKAKECVTCEYLDVRLAALAGEDGVSTATFKDDAYDEILEKLEKRKVDFKNKLSIKDHVHSRSTEETYEIKGEVG